MEKLDWVPLHVYRLKAKKSWNLPDYKFGWYMKLLMNMITSDNPGYLPNDDSVLWQEAGAKTKAYFQREGRGVIDSFFKRTADMRWIYDEDMLEVISKQTKKLIRPPSSISLSEGIDVVSIKNREFNSAETARYVMEELNLAGTKMHLLCQGAVDGAMRRFGLNAQEAAELVVMMWKEYEQADVQYKAGKRKFLEEGYWDKSMWKKGKGGRADAIRRAFSDE